MTAGQVTVFSSLPTIFWTLLNFVVLLSIPAALILGVTYLVRLNRRVRRLEDRLNHKGEEKGPNS